MPIYEYLCHSCGKKFEVLQKFSDAPIETHAECGGTVERLISTSALQFKGSGWYVNDYAKGTAKPGEAKAETKSEGAQSNGGGEAKSEAKSESKPAAAESKPTAGSSSSSESK